MQRILFSLAYIFTCGINHAQQYPFVHYTPKDGLANSRVRKAYQDSKGRMYFITYGGLSVYDGARFKNYTPQNSALTGLVNDVLEAGEDSLLIAVNHCSLYSLIKGQLKKINITGSHCPVVNNFLNSEDGYIYAAADNGLYRLKDNKAEKLPGPGTGEAEVLAYLGPLTEYKDFLVLSKNDLRQHTGFFLYNKKTSSVTDAMPGQYINCLKKDMTGIIWISTDKQVYNLDTAALQKGRLAFIKPYASFVNITHPMPGTIVFNRQNEPLIAGEKSIIRYRKEGGQLHIPLPDAVRAGPKDFFSDQEDVLWIGHDGNGIYKLPGTKLLSSSSYYSDAVSGISLVHPVSPDSNWVAANSNRLSLYTSAGVENFSFIPSFKINTFYYSNNYLYAAETNELYMAPKPAPGEKTIHFCSVHTLPETSAFGQRYINDPYGNLVLFESKNICVLNNGRLLFTYPLEIYDHIEGMHIDKNNQLWVISRVKGMQVFSLHPEKPSAYLQKKQEFLKEFEKASPRSVTVDKNGLLWAGTRYDGLIAFEYKDRRLTKKFHFHTENGLTDNFVTTLTTDRHNNIIAGTQTGLDRLIKTNDNNYRIENVTKSNNIFSYINTVWTDASDKTFALTNSRTVLQVSPAQNTEPQHEPQLLLEELRINGKSFLQHHSPLRLNYKQRNITFSVAAPSFLDEKQVTYSYLLSGSGNNNWSDTTTVADITLLNLPPGNYSLHVKAFFASTSYPPKEMMFTFFILPPWWQTWWFRSIAGLLIIGLLVAGFRFYYRRKLEKQKAALEKKQAVEKERTRIATDMHDDLGAGLSRIKFLSETIGIKKQLHQPIDEDIINIRDYSHEMISKMGEIVWALNEKNDSLNDLLSYTRSYAVEYLSQNGIACKVIVPEHIPEQYVTGEFRRNIYLSVKEALHNVIKHAQAKQVILIIETGKHIFISIHDDGIGYPGNHKPNSNGIMNMKQRMKDISGTFSIENSNGTIIRLSAPLSS